MTSLSALRNATTPEPVTIGELVGDTVSVLLTLDASISELHETEAEVTEFPVEVGANTTDHIRRKPKRIEINGIISNKPIAILASASASGIRGGPITSRDSDADAEIERWIDEAKLLVVSTTLKDYENMVVQAKSVVRDVDNGDVLNFTLRMREIILANTELVDAPDPVESNDKRKANKGRKPAQPSSAEVEERSTSTLNDAANALRKFTGF